MEAVIVLNARWNEDAVTIHMWFPDFLLASKGCRRRRHAGRRHRNWINVIKATLACCRECTPETDHVLSVSL